MWTLHEIQILVPIKFFLEHTATPIYLRIICNCFPATTAELSSCNKTIFLAHKA